MCTIKNQLASQSSTSFLFLSLSLSHPHMIHFQYYVHRQRVCVVNHVCRTVFFSLSIIVLMCAVCVSVFNFNVLSSHIDTNFLFVQAIMFVCDLAIRSQNIQQNSAAPISRPLMIKPFGQHFTLFGTRSDPQIESVAFLLNHLLFVSFFETVVYFNMTSGIQCDPTKL